jgi:hypothetical protein
MISRMLGLLKGKPSEKDIPTHPLDDIVSEGESLYACDNNKVKNNDEPLSLTDFANMRSNYYSVTPAGNLDLRPLGYELTAQHYQQQLNSNITFFLNHESFLQNVSDLLALFQKRDKNYRHAIIVIDDEDHKNHTILYIYLKENGREALLIPDSLGVSNTQAAKIHELTKLDLLCIKTQRQASDHGCDIDATILARDSTAILDNNQYYIPELLSKIKNRSTLFMTINGSNLYSSKLPDKLLTTAEISYFVTVNREETADTVYGFSSLDEFRSRYYAYDPTLKKNVNKFVEVTGWTLADEIEIQFYLNQLQTLLGEKLTPEFRKTFTEKAAAILQSHGAIHEHLGTTIQKNALDQDERVIQRPSLHAHISTLVQLCLHHNSNEYTSQARYS